MTVSRGMEKRISALLYRHILPYVGLFLVKAISSTYRLRIVDEDRERSVLEKDGSIIYASWHQRFFPGITFFASRRPIAILISQSRDGDFISHIVDILGWEPVRGSSSRGGSEGLQRLKELEEIDFDDVAGSGHTKKELLILKREKDKLEKTLGGIRTMARVPSAVWIVDTKKEHLAVDEARKLGLPVIAILDTNCDPDEVDYKIPGNDDAIRSVALLTRVIADAVADGLVARSSVRTGESAEGVAADEPLAEWERELYAEADAAAAAPVEAPAVEAVVAEAAVEAVEAPVAEVVEAPVVEAPVAEVADVVVAEEASAAEVAEVAEAVEAVEAAADEPQA